MGLNTFPKIPRRFLQRTKMTTHIINCDKKPFCPKGWKIEEHRKGGKFKWNTKNVSLYLSEKQKTGFINGNDLREELKDKPVLNANVLDYLLVYPQLIPEEWKGKFVFFWGTIYRGSVGYLYVRCLFWGGVRWGWVCRWLGNCWDGGGPAAVSAGVTNNLGHLDLTDKIIKIEIEGKMYKAILEKE